MDIGIICAMPLEAKGLTRLPTPCGQVVRISEYCLLVCSGIGHGNASRATLLLHEHGVGAVLSWGCAAGLQPNASPGTLVLPNAVLTEDGQRITVDSRLHRILLKKLPPALHARSGQLLTVAVPISAREQKAALWQRYGAGALDMESSAIGLAARRCRLPFAAVRAILDTVDQTLPATAVAGLQDDGSFNLSKGLSALARHPRDIIGLALLARNAHTARKVLKFAATDLITTPLI